MLSPAITTLSSPLSQAVRTGEVLYSSYDWAALRVCRKGRDLLCLSIDFPYCGKELLKNLVVLGPPTINQTWNRYFCGVIFSPKDNIFLFFSL